MTTTPTPSVSQIIPTGTSVGPWPTGWTYEVADDVRVCVALDGMDGPDLSPGADYTVTGATPKINGGTVTLDSLRVPTGGWLAGHRIWIRRRTARRQALALPDTEGHKPRATEGGLDKAMRIAEEDRDHLVRALTLPLGETGMPLPPLSARASKFAAYDAEGRPIAAVGTPGTVPISGLAALLLDDASFADMRATLGLAIEDIMARPYIIPGQGGLGASMFARFRYNPGLASFGYPVDNQSDITPALNAAMASGSNVHIPDIPGGLSMLTEPTYPVRYSLFGDENGSLLRKRFNGGAAFQLRGSGTSIKSLQVEFRDLSTANAGGLFDARTDQAGMEALETDDVQAFGSAFLFRDRAHVSNKIVNWHAWNVFGRVHRGIGCDVQCLYAFGDWNNLLTDFVPSPTLARANMIVWSIQNNYGGNFVRLETSNVARVEDAGMIGVRLRNCDATILNQAYMDGIAGPAYSIQGGVANAQLVNSGAGLCSGPGLLIRPTAGVNTALDIRGFKVRGRDDVGGYITPNAHGIDAEGVDQLDLVAVKLLLNRGSGIRLKDVSEVDGTAIKARANSRYGIEIVSNVSGGLIGGKTAFNALGDYATGGAGSATGLFDGRQIKGASGGRYDFAGVA